jgi:hypothetical protein
MSYIHRRRQDFSQRRRVAARIFAYRRMFMLFENFLWSALELRVTLLKHRKRHKLRSRPYLFYLLSGISALPHVVMAWGAYRSMMFIFFLMALQPQFGPWPTSMKLRFTSV